MGELIDVAAKIAAGFVAHGANSELLQARAGESMVSAVARASLDYAEALISDARQRRTPADAGAVVDAITRDAARYRLMRSNATFTGAGAGPMLRWLLPRWPREGTPAERLDAALDAEIQSRTAPRGEG